MSGSAEILAAFRELTNSKQIDRAELHGLLQDGINAALAKKHGPTVQAEVDIDENKGAIRIVLLKTVVEKVEDPGREISLEEARYEDAEFQVGDIMEEPVDFAEFGRSAVQAAKQRIIQRVREGERTKIRDEFSGRVGDLLSGEIQQIERGKLVVMLNKFREAEAIIPYREQNHREDYKQGEPLRSVLKKIEETPKGPRLVLSRADPMFVQALFKLEVPEIQQGIVEIKAAAREVRQPHQGRGRLQGRRHRSGGRLRRPQGRACRPSCRNSAASASTSCRGRPIPSGSPSWRWRRPRSRASSAIRRRTPSRPSSTRTSCRWPSAATDRTCGWRRSSPGWKIDLYSSREWLERGGDMPLFQPLPDEDVAAEVHLSAIEGLPPATIAVLEAGGFRTLNDIIDLDRDDFLRLPGIAPEEADRIMKMIDELTTEDSSGEAAAAPDDVTPDAPEGA